jgi:hypothetical protein
MKFNTEENNHYGIRKERKFIGEFVASFLLNYQFDRRRQLLCLNEIPTSMRLFGLSKINQQVFIVSDTILYN